MADRQMDGGSRAEWVVGGVVLENGEMMKRIEPLFVQYG
jgi:hypothetical protein